MREDTLIRIVKSCASAQYECSKDRSNKHDNEWYVQEYCISTILLCCPANREIYSARFRKYSIRTAYWIRVDLARVDAVLAVCVSEIIDIKCGNMEEEHVDLALAKGTKWVALIRRLARARNGLSLAVVRRLYLTVPVPGMLYAADTFLTLTRSIPGKEGHTVPWVTSAASRESRGRRCSS